jgi:hypothetical protein
MVSAGLAPHMPEAHAGRTVFGAFRVLAAIVTGLHEPSNSCPGIVACTDVHTSTCSSEHQGIE